MTTSPPTKVTARSLRTHFSRRQHDRAVSAMSREFPHAWRTRSCTDSCRSTRTPSTSSNSPVLRDAHAGQDGIFYHAICYIMAFERLRTTERHSEVSLAMARREPHPSPLPVLCPRWRKPSPSPARGLPVPPLPGPERANHPSHSTGPCSRRMRSPMGWFSSASSSAIASGHLKTDGSREKRPSRAGATASGPTRPARR